MFVPCILVSLWMPRQFEKKPPMIISCFVYNGGMVEMHVMLCYVMLLCFYVMLCDGGYVMLCYVMLYCANMLCCYRAWSPIKLRIGKKHRRGNTISHALILVNTLSIKNHSSNQRPAQIRRHDENMAAQSLKFGCHRDICCRREINF